MHRAFVMAAAVVAVSCIVAPAQADGPRSAPASLSRQQIRSMPVLERPNRPIHFYGNAVRRRHHRATTGGPALLPAPAAR